MPSASPWVYRSGRNKHRSLRLSTISGDEVLIDAFRFALGIQVRKKQTPFVASGDEVLIDAFRFALGIQVRKKQTPLVASSYYIWGRGSH